MNLRYKAMYYFFLFLFFIIVFLENKKVSKKVKALIQPLSLPFLIKCQNFTKDFYFNTPSLFCQAFIFNTLILFHLSILYIVFYFISITNSNDVCFLTPYFTFKTTYDIIDVDISHKDLTTFL